MQKDLATSIVLAVVGAVAAFFVTNLFIGEIQDVSVKTVDSSVNADLDEPDPEIFNYKALNPTVEVYVGNCTEYNEFGECIDEVDSEAPADDSSQGSE